MLGAGSDLAVVFDSIVSELMYREPVTPQAVCGDALRAEKGKQDPLPSFLWGSSGVTHFRQRYYITATGYFCHN